MLDSIVIIRWPKGYVAHLRFDDSEKDIDISHNYKSVLYGLVEAYVQRIQK